MATAVYKSLLCFILRLPPHLGSAGGAFFLMFAEHRHRLWHNASAVPAEAQCFPRHCVPTCRVPALVLLFLRRRRQQQHSFLCAVGRRIPRVGRRSIRQECGLRLPSVAMDRIVWTIKKQRTAEHPQAVLTVPFDLPHELWTDL